MTLPSVVDLVRVARRLRDLEDAVVFVGGCIVPLLVPEAIAPTIRPTDDVDCVVQAATTVEYYRLSERLRSVGFYECAEEGAPICRWIVEGVRVDVMPVAEAALGFSNRWYDQVLADPLEMEVVPGLRIRVARPATFLATKFEAFSSRGQGGYIGDTDFEDIVTVMAFRGDVVDAVLDADEPMRSYLCSCVADLLTRPDLEDLVSGCLDVPYQWAVAPVLAGMRRIARGPGHRTRVEWMGGPVVTLADLLRPGLLAVVVGVNPAPDSVAAGHYWQGRMGRTLWRRLRSVGLMPDGYDTGYEDDAAFEVGVGFTDVVKRATASAAELGAEERRHGRADLEEKLRRAGAPLVIFALKEAATTLLGDFSGNGFLSARIGGSEVFVMPGPYEKADRAEAVLDTLRRWVRLRRGGEGPG